MTTEETIEIIKKNKPTSDPRKCGKVLCEACDMVIEALDKQIPKKPKKIGFSTFCAVCGGYVIKQPFSNFCGRCGQKISWE